MNSLRKEKVELSEINQTEKYKDYVIPYMWKPEYKTDGYYKTEADSETQRMVTNGERRGAARQSVVRGTTTMYQINELQGHITQQTTQPSFYNNFTQHNL